MATLSALVGVLGAGGGFAGGEATTAAAEPDPLGARAADLLSRAIRLETVNPPGSERPLAALLVAEASAAELEARLVPTPDGPGGVERAAAWARLPGRGSRRPLVLLSHLDVVPADAAHWERDPFGGVVDDTYVHGRGALDAKGVAVTHVLALALLAQREEPLERDVLLLATPDEETGGLDGAGWLARERPELFARAEFVLTEGGSIQLGRNAEPEVWGVAVTEKAPCWLRVSARGRPGHSSAPDRDAAVPRLVRALDRVRRIETQVRVLPAVERMFRELAPTAPPEDRPAYADLASALQADALFARRFLDQRAHNALVRNTVAITVLEGAPRTNVLPAEAAAHLDARLLPGQSCEAFAAEIEQVIDDPRVELEVLLSFPSRTSPVDTPLFRAIERVARETGPEALVVPRMISGFTDAHWFRQRGIVAYGFVPRWLDLEDVSGIHGPNERISIRNLSRGIRTLVRIVETLDTED